MRMFFFFRTAPKLHIGKPNLCSILLFHIGGPGNASIDPKISPAKVFQQDSNNHNYIRTELGNMNIINDKLNIKYHYGTIKLIFSIIKDKIP